MILDASSIYTLIKLGKPEVLVGGTTLELAVYELGNAIWKEVAVFKTISVGEAIKILSVVKRCLEVLDITSIKDGEEGALRLACERGLSFYDAAYLYLAQTRAEPLVTEDGRLREVASKLVKAMSVAQLL